MKHTYPTSAPDTSTNYVVSRSEKLLLSAAEVGHLLSLAPRTVYALIESGKIPCVRIGSRVRVPYKAVKEIAEGGA